MIKDITYVDEKYYKVKKDKLGTEKIVLGEHYFDISKDVWGDDLLLKLILVEYKFREKNKYTLLAIYSRYDSGKDVINNKKEIMQYIRLDKRRIDLARYPLGDFDNMSEFEKWISNPYYLLDTEYNLLKEYVANRLTDMFDCFYAEKNNKEPNFLLSTYLDINNYKEFQEFILEENTEIYKELNFSKWSIYNWQYFFNYLSIAYDREINDIGDITKSILAECNYTDEEAYILHKSWAYIENKNLGI